MIVPSLLSHLLPGFSHFHLDEQVIESEAKRVTLSLSSTEMAASCPVCHHISHSVHSHYQRTVQDLNWADYSVTLFLCVRKFFCRNRACQRRIFCERLPELTAAWSRRTHRLTAQLQQVAVALGGSPGNWLLSRLGYSFSRDTLLRSLAKIPLPTFETPQQLGVDDFAFRKGQRYGTILVDLERHCPIALLEDRQASTLATWLQEHPGVQVLSRDRSTTYKSAMSEAAPDAVQVADRFHLLQNLTEALEDCFSERRSTLCAVEKAYRFGIPIDSLTALDVDIDVDADVDVVASTPVTETSAARSQRLKIYRRVWRLHLKGYSYGAIAQKTGVSVRTVQRYLKTSSFPERQPRCDRGRSLLLAPFQAFLLEQYHQGCRHVRSLFAQLQQLGYKGSYMTVCRFFQQLDLSHGVPVRRLPSIRARTSLPARILPPLTPRQAAFLVLRLSDSLSAEQQKLLSLLSQQPDVAPAIGLALSFAALVRQRQPHLLDAWLQQATNCSFSPLVRFANGLVQDYHAVTAALTLSTSNGQVEGQVNRLKMLKRQMYGRAGLPLLQRRFLLLS